MLCRFPYFFCRQHTVVDQSVVVEYYFTLVHALSVDEHKHSPARTRYSNQVLYTMFIFLTKNQKNKIKTPNGWRTIKSLVHKIRLHSRRGKGMAESFSREKLRHGPRKKVAEKSCVTFLLRDPGWYVQRT